MSTNSQPPADDPTADPQIRQEILRLRASIDNIDAALMHLLAERFKFTHRVGELKAQAAVLPADPARDREQIQRLTSIAEAAGLDPEFAGQFREFIVSEVIRHHTKIAQEYGEVRPLDTYS
ncbi:chorismate mutase [Jonesia quinghaiensis]|uniref:chorismate mutase n=1 Tax=Jonesia quinghaiensis TaxID=262806 RepID=UPI000424983E|nr:chorismate mutase [Jonesia quinghaiensis]